MNPADLVVRRDVVVDALFGVGLTKPLDASADWNAVTSFADPEEKRVSTVGRPLPGVALPRRR